MVEVDVAEAELPLETVGVRLLRAREAAGLSRTQVAAMTRIPERHLAAIEENNFAALPARTYATGFSRSYAKVLGLNPDEIVAAVREELARQEPSEPRRMVQTFEPGDPARVPSGRLVWFAVLGILAVLAVAFVLARSMFAPAAELPSILTEETAAPVATDAGQAVVPVGGAVVFTALEPRVWVKFTDAAGNQLFQKELAQGETWTVPADQADVRIATARPDALAITVGGQPVPKLSDAQKSVRDVPVTAAALLARGTAAAVSVPVASAAPPQQRNAAPPRQRERSTPDRAAAQPVPSATVEPVVSPAAAPAPTASAT
jgi:cytoskeleton protein RodZ